jgi:hypothetical protein
MFGGNAAMLVSHLVSDHPLSAKELRTLHAALGERLDRAEESTDTPGDPKRRRSGGKR